MPIGDELKDLKLEDITYGDEGLEVEQPKKEQEDLDDPEEGDDLESGDEVGDDPDDGEDTDEGGKPEGDGDSDGDNPDDEDDPDDGEDTDEGGKPEGDGDSEKEKKNNVPKEDEFEEVDLEAEMATMVTEATGGKYKDLNGVLAELSDLKNLLKDDYIVNAAKHYNSSGSLTPYLEATAVDYDKMGDVDILKSNWLKENDGLDPKFHDALFKEEVLANYRLDGSEDYEESDIELGTAKLKRDANKLRTQLKSEQEKFKQPPVREENPDSPDGDIEEVTPEQKERYSKEVTASIVKHFSKSKDGKENILPVQIAQDVVHNIGISQEILDKAVNYALDTDSLLGEFLDDDDNGDYSKWVDMVSFLENPEAYRKAIWDSGKSAGRTDFKKEVKGIKPKTTAKPARKQGESGDDKVDLLKEALKQKREREAAGLR